MKRGCCWLEGGQRFLSYHDEEECGVHLRCDVNVGHLEIGRCDSCVDAWFVGWFVCLLIAFLLVCLEVVSRTMIAVVVGVMMNGDDDNDDR